MGGGKSSPAPEKAKPINTTTVVGDMLDPKPKKFDEKKEKESKVKVAKKGTRGLQIPKKDIPKTPATTGVQL